MKKKPAGSNVYTAIISLTLDAFYEKDAIDTCLLIANDLSGGRGGNMDIGASCVEVKDCNRQTIFPPNI